MVGQTSTLGQVRLLEEADWTSRIIIKVVVSRHANSSHCALLEIANHDGKSGNCNELL